MPGAPEATEALWAVSKAWPHPLRVIPAIEWTDRAKKYTRRVLQVSYSLIVGTMLEMWDSIERDLKRSNNHRTLHAEAATFQATALERTEFVLWCVRSLNEGSTTAITCNNRIKELIGPVDADARTAFEWTAPDGVVERDELDFARLEQSTKNVRVLNGMLNHNIRDELERYNSIVSILDEVECYLSGTAQERTSSETALHQFTINFARFMTTHNNNNKLPVN